MEKVVKVRKKYRNQLQAVTHLDNSARIQTVNKNENNDFYIGLEGDGKWQDEEPLTDYNNNGIFISCSYSV